MRSTPIQNKGVQALEFALVFPILFLMLYGLLTYSIIFAVQHTLNMAAADGARASVRFLSANDLTSAREAAACSEIEKSLAWIRALGYGVTCPGNAANGVNIALSTVPCVSANLHCLDISIQYRYKAFPVIPVLLPVPDALTAHAQSQFSLKY